MTLPDRTDSSRPNKSHTRSARSPNKQHPGPRHIHEDIDATDAPLYQREPERKLQRPALHWVAGAFVAALACTCITAIATGSIPVALVTADVILALALFGVAAYIFPRR